MAAPPSLACIRCRRCARGDRGQGAATAQRHGRRDPRRWRCHRRRRPRRRGRSRRQGGRQGGGLGSRVGQQGGQGGEVGGRVERRRGRRHPPRRRHRLEGGRHRRRPRQRRQRGGRGGGGEGGRCCRCTCGGRAGARSGRVRCSSSATTLLALTLQSQRHPQLAAQDIVLGDRVSARGPRRVGRGRQGSVLRRQLFHPDAQGMDGL